MVRGDASTLGLCEVPDAAVFDEYKGAPPLRGAVVRGARQPVPPRVAGGDSFVFLDSNHHKRCETLGSPTAHTHVWKSATRLEANLNNSS